MTVVTLSRQLGSGGGEIARRVAQTLGLQLVDRDRLRQAAEAAGVPRVAFQELTYEGQRTLVEEMLQILQSVPATPVAPAVSGAEVIGPFRIPFGGAFASPLPSVASLVEEMEGYLNIVGMVVRDLAAERDVLFLGQGGQVILQDREDVLHVLVVADLPDRVAAVARGMDLTTQEARRRVRVSDKARSEFLRRYYRVEWLDPRHYHLVLNTSRLPLDAAVRVVVEGARALGKGVESSPRQEGAAGPGNVSEQTGAWRDE
ncbi:MAG: cytidylate kinase-like family protein [Anaerolineae bacterium]